MPYVVAQPCVDVKDKACVDECPVDCIYEGSRSLYINPNECVDCGACEPVCPTEAIFYEDDLPDEWAWYKDAAVSFFAEVGDLGGASAAGPIGRTRSRSPRFLRRTSDHGLLNRRAVHFARRADLDGRFVFWTGSTSTFPCAEGEPVFRMDGRPCRRADCRMLEHGLRFPLEKETYGWAFMSSRHRTIGRASHPTSARRRPRSAA